MVMCIVPVSYSFTLDSQFAHHFFNNQIWAVVLGSASLIAFFTQRSSFPIFRTIFYDPLKWLLKY